MKACIGPDGTGCPVGALTAHGNRCDSCRPQRERRRGSRQERGYDRAHELLRLRWVPKVASGKVDCWSCRERIGPLSAWDLGHCEDDRTVTHGPQHVACNRDTSAPGCKHPSHRRVRISPDA